MKFFKQFVFFRKKEGKNEFGESPNSLQTQKNMRAQLFFEWLHVFLKNKLCTHIFLSLERSRRFSKLMFSFFWKTTFFFEKWHQAKISLWTWSDLQTLQTRSKLICFHFFCFIFFLFYFFFEKEEWVWSEFGDSPNSLQTHVFSFLCYLLFWTRGMSLEWVWRFSKLTPNSVQTHMFMFFLFCLFLEKRNEFGVSLEIFQTFSKLDPNSNDLMIYCVFPLLFFIFVWKRQTRSKLICF